MNKKLALVYVNALLALAFVLTAAVGIMQFLAPGLMPYGIFRLIHPISGLTFVTLAIIHIMLNSAWIKLTYFKKKK